MVTYTLNKHDKYIIIASDGIWEFLSNNEVLLFNKFVNHGGFRLQR